MKRAKTPDSLVFDGMAADVAHQAESAAEVAGEDLTARLREPLGDISGKAGAMETDAPLFYGQIHPTLF